MKAMKKLIATSLVVVMLFALAVPAVAWVYHPDHIKTKADANSTNLIASADEEIVLNAGKLPANTNVVLGGAKSDANWKYAYPFQLDKLFTPGAYSDEHHTDMYFMWDEDYLYIKEYRRDALTLPASDATAVNGPEHDAVEYNLMAPGINFSDAQRAVGLVLDIFPTVTSTSTNGVSENRVIGKLRACGHQEAIVKGSLRVNEIFNIRYGIRKGIKHLSCELCRYSTAEIVRTVG